MKHLLLSCICVLALAGCQTTASATKKAADSGPASGTSAKTPIEITGSASTTMRNEPIVPNDPNVQVYQTEGPLVNPLVTDRTHSVLDNTTAGGFPVFDDSVTVYPLPGEETPDFLPSYAVPPLQSQYKPEQPHIGAPMGLASAGMLPPVPNVDVPEADPYAKPPVSGAMYTSAAVSAAARQPMTLTAAEPLTMQAPAQARPPMASPFMKAQPMVVEAQAVTPVAPAPVGNMTTMTNAGRRSSPMLTGY